MSLQRVELWESVFIDRKGNGRFIWLKTREYVTANWVWICTFEYSFVFKQNGWCNWYGLNAYPLCVRVGVIFQMLYLAYLHSMAWDQRLKQGGTGVMVRLVRRKCFVWYVPIFSTFDILLAVLLQNSSVARKYSINSQESFVVYISKCQLIHLISRTTLMYKKISDYLSTVYHVSVWFLNVIFCQNKQASYGVGKLGILYRACIPVTIPYS